MNINNEACQTCSRKSSAWCVNCYRHPATYTSANSVRCLDNYKAQKS